MINPFSWLRRFARRVRVVGDMKRARRTGKLCCENCGRNLHKFDKYVITSTKHISCADPKMVGQESLNLELKK